LIFFGLFFVFKIALINNKPYVLKYALTQFNDFFGGGGVVIYINLPDL